MFVEPHIFIYILPFVILVTLKVGLFDSIREFFYDKNNVKLENRKYIFGAKLIYNSEKNRFNARQARDKNKNRLTFKKNWFDEYLARRAALFSYLGTLVISSLILYGNLS